MSNKTQLQTNNNTLDTLITRVNAAKEVAASLPNAGNTEDLNAVITELENKVTMLNTTLDGKASGGGSVGTCTIDITASGANISQLIYHDGEKGVYETFSSTQSITITIAKNSILYVGRSASTVITKSQNITTLTAGGTEVFFAVDATSDYGSITLTKTSGGPV